MSTKTKTKPKVRRSLHAVARRHRAEAKREAGKAVRERMDAENEGRSGDALCASRAHAYWCARISAIDDLLEDVSPSHVLADHRSSRTISAPMTIPSPETTNAEIVACSALVCDENTLRAKSGVGGGAEPERREVVKLVTSSWHDKRGLHIRRDLLSVKRKSSGHQCLEEDCNMISPDEVWPRIVNLNECKDGLYEVVICNEWKDWETGYVEDYDYRLVAFGGGGEEARRTDERSSQTAEVSHATEQPKT